MKVLWIGYENGVSSLAGALRAAGHEVFVATARAGTRRQPSETGAARTFDLLARDDVFDVVDLAHSALGAMDLVVFAAAFDAAFEVPGRDGDDAERTQLEVMDSLVYGGFACTQAVLRHLCAARQGSMAYLVADPAADGRLGTVGVSAGSCGLLALGSSIAGPVFRSGVNVNSVIVGAPFDSASMGAEGPVGAGATLAYAPSAAQLALRDSVLHELYLRDGTTWHSPLVDLLEHLASPQGAMICGATLRLPNVGKASPLFRWSF